MNLFLATALNSYFEFTERSKNAYVLLEKTFPRLTSFTISTWLQVFNYSSPSTTLLRSALSKKDVKTDWRTLFTYSTGNQMRC